MIPDIRQTERNFLCVQNSLKLSKKNQNTPKYFQLLSNIEETHKKKIEAKHILQTLQRQNNSSNC